MSLARGVDQYVPPFSMMDPHLDTQEPMVRLELRSTVACTSTSPCGAMVKMPQVWHLGVHNFLLYIFVTTIML